MTQTELAPGVRAASGGSPPPGPRARADDHHVVLHRLTLHSSGLEHRAGEHALKPCTGRRWP